MTEITSRSPVLPPPTERYTLIGWLHKNLFSTWYNTLLTFLALGMIYALLKPVMTWLFTQANWEVVQVNIRLLSDTPALTDLVSSFFIEDCCI